MTYPDKYSRGYGFASFQESHPTTPLPGNQVDTELDAVSKTQNELVDFLKGFVRSDGKLANNSVGVDQLTADLTIGFKAPTTWAPNSQYALDDTVWYQSAFYTCTTAHTAGASFAPANWSLIVDFGAQAAAAATSAAQAAASAATTAGFWGKPVLSVASAPPGSPATGARYLVAHSGTSGVFVGKEDQIAEYATSGWNFSGAPAAGQVLMVGTSGYVFDGTAWNRELRLKSSLFKTAGLAAAFTAAAAIGAVLDIDIAWAAPATDTSYAAASFQYAGGIIATGAKTLTFAGTPIAPDGQRLFDISGGGSVIFSGSKSASVGWFGVLGSGGDDTPFFTAATTAIGNTDGAVRVPAINGVYKVNWTVTSNGVNYVFPTSEKNVGTPGSKNYLTAYNTSNPVVQVGADTGFVSGNNFYNMALYGGNTCAKGLYLFGGALQNNFFGFNCINFTTWGVRGLAGANYPVDANNFYGVVIQSSTRGCDSVYLEDPYFGANANVTYCTSTSFFGGHIDANSPGFAVRCNGSTGNKFHCYIQGSPNDPCILYEQSSGYPAAPECAFFSNVDELSSPSVAAIIAYGEPAAVGSPVAAALGGLNATGGGLLFAPTTTTASGSSGQANVTLGSNTGVWAGRSLLIDGGAANGGSYLATVDHFVSGTTWALTANLPAALSGNNVRAGLFVPEIASVQTGGGFYLNSNGLYINGGNRKIPLPGAHSGTLIRPGAGSVAPFAAYDLVWDLGAVGMNVLCAVNSATVSSITQSGTTVTVSLASGHGLQIGDTAQVDGAKEGGINGYHAVASIPTSSSFTYTSEVSQTVAGATGTLSFRGFKNFNFKNGNLLVPGALQWRDQTGAVTNQIFQDPASGNFYVSCNGTLLLQSSGGGAIEIVKALFYDAPQFNAAATGSGSALLGGNSPSAHLSAPYTWVDVKAPDGTLCTMPVWQK